MATHESCGNEVTSPFSPVTSSHHFAYAFTTTAYHMPFVLDCTDITRVTGLLGPPLRLCEDSEEQQKIPDVQHAMMIRLACFLSDFACSCDLQIQT
jgi:hypothetical protein